VLSTEDQKPPMPTHHSSAPSKRLIVPYVTAWSTERDLPMPMIEHRGFGIGYADEIATDRDTHGVLWQRTYSRPSMGRPVFGDVHSLRQRRAMRKLLCQVCGGPADQNDDGVLWLLPDHHEDWDSWPEAMGNVEPPICLACVEISLRLCPKLRRDGGAAIRAKEYSIVGVRGALYAPGPSRPVMVADQVVAFDDPVIRWVRAAGLIRQLSGCTIVPVEELVSDVKQ
jgi:hypothetical protein